MVARRKLTPEERLARVVRYFVACGWVYDPKTDLYTKGKLRLRPEAIRAVCIAEDTPQKAIKYIEAALEPMELAQ